MVPSFVVPPERKERMMPDNPQLVEPMPAQSIADMPWVDPPTLPPTDLPYDDGEPMESPWHASNGPLLKASYVAVRGGKMTDYYVGVNMFVYYGWQQVRNKDYKGPDVFFALDVEGERNRLYWAIWDEDGKYPDVIVEFLSDTTEKEDLGKKKDLYEQRFRTPEYFCVSREVERLFGWRLAGNRYTPILPAEDGRLWSEQLGLFFGPWQGLYLGEQHTWLRLFHSDGTLVLISEEAERERADAERERAEAAQQRADAERERADAERERADHLAVRAAELEAELRRLRGEE
jgi:Uma2 family endonuclease